MPRKCPHCNGAIIGKPISKLPLWEGDPFKSKFNWEALKWRNLNLMNLIIGDWINLIVILSILFVAYAYMHDSAAYREIYSDPCGYVKKNVNACLGFEKYNVSLLINPDLTITEIQIEND